MSIWTIILREIVKDAFTGAVRDEFGTASNAFANAIQDPEGAAKEVINSPEAKKQIKNGLTEIFRAILRVFK